MILQNQGQRSKALVFLDVSFWNSARRIIRSQFDESVFIICDILTQRYSLLVCDGNRTELIKVLHTPPAPRLGVMKFARYFIIGPIFFVAMSLMGIRRANSEFQMCIGSAWLFVIWAIILRKLRFVNRVIYWAIDWPPPARQDASHQVGRLLLSIVHRWGDKFCVDHADQTWNLTEKIGSSRSKHWNEHSASPQNYRTVYPVMQHLISSDDYFTSRTSNIIFVGRDNFLNEAGGVRLAVKALKKLRNRLPLTLTVITGSNSISPLRKSFIDFLRSENADEWVRVLGYLPEPQLSKELANSMCGLALFDDSNNVSNFGFPGKVLLYLEHGLPVITSPYLAIAHQLAQLGAGLVIPFSVENLCQALSLVYADHMANGDYRRNAKHFANSHLAGQSLTKAMAELIHTRDAKPRTRNETGDERAG